MASRVNFQPFLACGTNALATASVMWRLGAGVVFQRAEQLRAVREIFLREEAADFQFRIYAGTEPAEKFQDDLVAENQRGVAFVRVVDGRLQCRQCRSGFPATPAGAWPPPRPVRCGAARGGGLIRAATGRTPERQRLHGPRRIAGPPAASARRSHFRGPARRRRRRQRPAAAQTIPRSRPRIQSGATPARRWFHPAAAR